MRDPCLAEGPDGTFHLVWSSGWTAEKGKIIGYAHSKNLLASFTSITTPRRSIMAPSDPKSSNTGKTAPKPCHFPPVNGTEQC